MVDAFHKASYRKPLFTVDEQIAHMKAKGISFDLCAESEAHEYLDRKCNFFKVYSYRKLFDKRVGGPHDGEYANLDFGQLKLLASLDQQLREIMLPMTLDIEHFTKVGILQSCEANGEDGYSIIADYLDSLSHDDRRYRERELETNSRSIYSAKLYVRYREDMPVWVFSELISFGLLIDFVRFCGSRWQDPKLDRRYFDLKFVKSLRNCFAHGSCFLNGLDDAEPSRSRVSHEVSDMIVSFGIPKRLRLRRMRNARMQQVATLLYLYKDMAPDGRSKQRTIRGLSEFFERVHENESIIARDSRAGSSIEFMKRLTGGVGMIQ